MWPCVVNVCALLELLKLLSFHCFLFSITEKVEWYLKSLKIWWKHKSLASTAVSPPPSPWWWCVPTCRSDGAQSHSGSVRAQSETGSSGGRKVNIWQSSGSGSEICSQEIQEFRFDFSEAKTTVLISFYFDIKLFFSTKYWSILWHHRLTLVILCSSKINFDINSSK